MVKFFKNFSWIIVALQCWVSFCCTAKWISYTYTCIPWELYFRWMVREGHSGEVTYRVRHKSEKEPDIQEDGQEGSRWRNQNFQSLAMESSVFGTPSQRRHGWRMGVSCGMRRGSRWQTTHSFSPVKEFGFYSRWNGNPMSGFLP